MKEVILLPIEPYPFTKTFFIFLSQFIPFIKLPNMSNNGFFSNSIKHVNTVVPMDLLLLI